MCAACVQKLRASEAVVPEFFASFFMVMKRFSVASACAVAMAEKSGVDAWPQNEPMFRARSKSIWVLRTAEKRPKGRWLEDAVLHA